MGPRPVTRFPGGHYPNTMHICYQKMDLTATLTMTRAGILCRLRKAGKVREQHKKAATNLKAMAKAMRYNLASFT